MARSARDSDARVGLFLPRPRPRASFLYQLLTSNTPLQRGSAIISMYRNIDIEEDFYSARGKKGFPTDSARSSRWEVVLFWATHTQTHTHTDTHTHIKYSTPVRKKPRRRSRAEEQQGSELFRRYLSVSHMSTTNQQWVWEKRGAH